jgi:hypothetical protein
MYIDDCQLKGVVNLVLRDKDGKVKQHKTIRNKVTDHGLAHLIGRMIDDRQDKKGAHEMPRMMSHMAVGIGGSARSNPNTYNLTSSVYPAADRTAAIPQKYDRMLQDERGSRVQLMKDTTLKTDYAPVEHIVLTRSTTIGSDGDLHAVVGGKSVITISTGSTFNSIDTIGLLQPNEIIAFTAFDDGATGTSLVAPSSYTNLTDGVNGYKIESIEIVAARGEAKITLTTQIDTNDLPPKFSSSPAHDDNVGDRTVFSRVEYVGRIRNKKEVYASGQIDSAYQSVFPLNSRPHLDLDSNFAGDAHPTFGNGVGNTFSEFGGTATISSTGSSIGGLGPFIESGGPVDDDDVKLLGVSRGQIGLFYERDLVTTDLSLLVPFDDGNGFVETLSQRLKKFAGGNGHGETQAGFSSLVGTTGKFPFKGEPEDKPATTSTKEFVQFGTAVDGIFQGSSVGSSISEDSGKRAEGYPTSENNYGAVGGLKVYSTVDPNKYVLPDGNGGTQDTNAIPNLLSYSTGPYTPNAQIGGKKSGTRIVYVATFKENNPRLETDRDPRLHNLTDTEAKDISGNNRSPIDGVYPICEAGIFNKHKPDVGIFDIGDRTDPDQRVAGTESQQADYINNSTTTNGVDGLAAGKIPLQEEERVANSENFLKNAVLTTGGEKVSANAHGFTQGPVTQTMLCRTTFSAINKAVTDTLQITWSIELQDASV